MPGVPGRGRNLESERGTAGRVETTTVPEAGSGHPACYEMGDRGRACARRRIWRWTTHIRPKRRSEDARGDRAGNPAATQTGILATYPRGGNPAVIRDDGGLCKRFREQASAR